MKLATLKNSSRDGELIVVSKDLGKAVSAGHIAATMQAALDNWDQTAPQLSELYEKLNAGKAEGSFEFRPEDTAAPFPRAYQWLDGSVFNNHGKLMARAFNIDEIPGTDAPLIYQGSGDDFLGPCDDLPCPSEDLGIDFEGEVGIVVDDVPMGTDVGEAESHIKLLTQINDFSFRNHALRELKIGFGWLHAKPTTSFAPVLVTPDELGDTWRDGRIHLPLHIKWNGEWFGNPNAGEMSFSFMEIIEYVCRTRNLGTGTIIGSGTVSNQDFRNVGSACIAERRGIELIDSGEAKTGFMEFGDRVFMEMRDAENRPLFGAIDQKIVPAA